MPVKYILNGIKIKRILYAVILIQLKCPTHGVPPNVSRAKKLVTILNAI
jgi:hypothetical protein